MTERRHAIPELLHFLLEPSVTSEEAARVEHEIRRHVPSLVRWRLGLRDVRGWRGEAALELGTPYEDWARLWRLLVSYPHMVDVGLSPFHSGDRQQN